MKLTNVEWAVKTTATAMGFLLMVVFVISLGALLEGCAGTTSISAAPEAAAVDLKVKPIGAWSFGPELAEQLLRSGPTARFDSGRIVAAGRATSRDLQFAVSAAEHQAQVVMVSSVGQTELVLSPRTEWRGVTKNKEGRFVVTVLVTADVGGGSLK